LYELKERDLKVPIFLSYHASAHKVEDQASRVGLGWSVSAGGMVTRTIRGLPDEYGPGGFLHQAAEMGQVGAYALGSDEEKYGWYDAMARGCRSAEPDIYYFSVAGYSGQFQFDWDGSICIASDAKLLITPIGLNPNNDTFIQAWKIVTPDGVRWTFDIKESISTRFEGPEILADPCRAILERKKPPQAWYLADIASPFTDSHVRFEYSDYVQSLERWSQETQVHNENLSPATPKREKLISDVGGKYLSVITTSSGDTTIEFIPGPNRTDVTGTALQALSEIRVRNRNDSIVKWWKFEYDYSVGRLTLKSLRECSNSDIMPPFSFDYYGGQLPSALSFRQDHWGYYNRNSAQTLIPQTVVRRVGGDVILDGANRSSAPDLLTTGMLKQITYPTGGADHFDFEPHEHSFEQSHPLTVPVTTHEQLSGAAPAFDTPAGQEHVERTPFNALDEVEIKLTASFSYGMKFGSPAFLPSVAIETNDGNEVFRLAPGGSAAPDGTPTQKIMILVFNPRSNSETIGETNLPPQRLPAGSYVFVVRCKQSPSQLGRNSVAARLAWEAPTGHFTTQRVQGAGVRIARITRTYGFGNPDKVVTYHYTTLVEGTEASSGSLLESYYVYEKWMTYSELSPGPTIPGSTETQKFVRFSQNRSSLGTTQGSHVGYSKVMVATGVNPVVGAVAVAGISVYNYTSPIDFPDFVDSDVPFPPPSSKDYKRGLLVDRSDYKSDSRRDILEESVLPVRRIVNTYNFLQRIVPALKVGWMVPGDGLTGPGFLHRYAVKGYSNIIGYARLTTREEHLNEPPNSFVTRGDYLFQEDGHKQLSVEITSSSEGGFTTEYTYPSSYPRHRRDAGIDELVKQHVAGAVIEKVISRDDGIVIAAERNGYGLFQGKVHQTHFETAAIGDGLVARGQALEVVADLYEVRGIYHAYDFHGNILEFSRPGGMVTCLIWDGPGTQLVARVDNARRGQVFYNGFEDDLQDTTTAQAYTGLRSKFISGVYTLQVADLPRLAGDYLFSYWKKVGGGAWTRVERIIRNYLPGTAISTDAIDGFLDEVRLHPLDALMTTFAHQPLIGLQTSTDANGLPTYFEYDSFGRLSTVRDRNQEC
jgi:YD repeat-containing protein